MLFAIVPIGTRFEVCEEGCSLTSYTPRSIIWLDNTISPDIVIDRVELEVGDILEYLGERYSGIGSDGYPDPFFRALNFEGHFSPCESVMCIDNNVLRKVFDDRPISTLRFVKPIILLTSNPIISQKPDLVSETLANYLLSGRFTFSMTGTDIIEEIYDVSLMSVFAGKHMHLKPILKTLGYNFEEPYASWQHKQTLKWDKEAGWNISNDEKIAICRAKYDEYHIFLIESIDFEKIKEPLPLPSGWFKMTVSSKLQFSDIFLFLSFLCNESFGDPDGMTFMKKRDVKMLLQYGIAYPLEGENRGFALNTNKHLTKAIFRYCMYKFYTLFFDHHGAKKEILQFISKSFVVFKDMELENLEKNFTGNRPKKGDFSSFDSNYVKKLTNTKRHKLR